jgi:hypothetical protein
MFVVQDGTVAYGPFPTREEAEELCSSILANPQVIGSGDYGVGVLELRSPQEMWDRIEQLK